MIEGGGSRSREGGDPTSAGIDGELRPSTTLGGDEDIVPRTAIEAMPGEEGSAFGPVTRRCSCHGYRMRWWNMLTNVSLMRVTKVRKSATVRPLSSSCPL